MWFSAVEPIVRPTRSIPAPVCKAGSCAPSTAVSGSKGPGSRALSSDRHDPSMIAVPIAMSTKWVRPGGLTRP